MSVGVPDVRVNVELSIPLLSHNPHLHPLTPSTLTHSTPPLTLAQDHSIPHPPLSEDRCINVIRHLPYPARVKKGGQISFGGVLWEREGKGRGLGSWLHRVCEGDIWEYGSEGWTWVYGCKSETAECKAGLRTHVNPHPSVQAPTCRTRAGTSYIHANPNHTIVTSSPFSTQLRYISTPTSRPTQVNTNSCCLRWNSDNTDRDELGGPYMKRARVPWTTHTHTLTPWPGGVRKVAGVLGCGTGCETASMGRVNWMCTCTSAQVPSGPNEHVTITFPRIWASGIWISLCSEKPERLRSGLSLPVPESKSLPPQFSKPGRCWFCL